MLKGFKTFLLRGNVVDQYPQLCPAEVASSSSISRSPRKRVPRNRSPSPGTICVDGGLHNPQVPRAWKPLLRFGGRSSVEIASVQAGMFSTPVA